MCKLCVNYYLYICICICKLLYYNVCVCMCVLGANFLHNYFEASLAAMFFTTLSGILLLFLPAPKPSLSASLASTNELAALDAKDERDVVGKN